MLATGNNKDMIIKSKDEIVQQSNILIEYFKGWIPGIESLATTILISLIIFFIGKKIIKVILRILDQSCSKIGTDEGAGKFIISVAKILLNIILFMIIGGQFGLSSASVIALLGSAGIAIGLAFQGSLSNFAGGILLLILKPFKLGDYIVAQGTGNEGTVVNIDIFYTKLLTVDNKMIAMPNGNLINSTLTNVTSEAIRRLDITIGIGYDSDIKMAKNIIETVMKSDIARLTEKEMYTFVSELADSAVILGGRMWVKTEEYWTAKWRITENIKIAFDENGVAIPFNQLDVTIKNK
ncbi:MAG: mechanosensitive ion channel family protein [Lachnotalea sp.]